MKNYKYFNYYSPLQRGLEQDPGQGGRGPVETVRVHRDPQRPLHLLHVRVHLGPVDAEEELVLLRLLDEAQQHEGKCDVVRVQRGLGAQLLDGDVAATPHPGEVIKVV